MTYQLVLDYITTYTAIRPLKILTINILNQADIGSDDKLVLFKLRKINKSEKSNEALEHETIKK